MSKKTTYRNWRDVSRERLDGLDSMAERPIETPHLNDEEVIESVKESKKDTYGITNIGVVRVYDEPNLNANTHHNIYKGTRVIVISRTGDWSRIRSVFQPVYIGYIPSEYLDPSD